MKKLTKKILITTIILTLFLITISSANAADVHMNLTNNTIANAVENQTNNTDTIYLDEGIYNHTHLNGTNGININKNLTIIGKGADKTLIDAQKLGRIFNIESDGILTLINLTLINGKENDGGAIYNNEGTLTLKNCILTNNSVMHYGGAVYNNVGNITVINSKFIDNYAESGGGAISNQYGDGVVIPINNIINSTFINNTSVIGGAINNVNDNIMTINNSIFINNTAFSNGGAINNYADNLTITNSIFITNTAEYSGGAISNWGGSNTIINNSTFTNNTVITDDFDGGGGAISNNYNQNINIANSTFNNNTAVSRGGAIYNVGVENMNIINSNFTNNIANDTGAIYNEDVNNVSITSCNILNNSQGIKIIGDSSNNNINYNRIFNNTHYDLNNTGTNTNADYNWWGSNNPDMTKILGIIPANYFVMNVTNLTSLDSNGTVTFQYTFKLNNSDSFNASLLPYFVTDVYTNLTNGVIESFDGRYDNVFDITVNSSGDILYTFITDNEVQTLEGTTTIPDPVDPEDPTDPVDPVDPIDPIDPDEPINDNNQTSNNPTASAVMKETGIPINMILLVLISILGVLIGRKQN